MLLLVYKNGKSHHYYSQTHLPPMASNSMRRSSGSELLHDLQALNQSLSQPPISGRRNASLTLPSSNLSHDPSRLSLSSWRKPQTLQIPQHFLPSEQKRGIRNWKPIRMLTHIGMRRISCLFVVEIIAIRNLPESMNGIRLSVGVRKRESRDGVVRGLPSRVLRGCAEFEETLFIQSHLHCSGGAATGKPIKLEPRPFVISVLAIDGAELELGRTIVDLSQLIIESIEGSLEGARIRKWDVAVELTGKAEGGQLDLKLGFQIMDDGGTGIYDRVVESERMKSNKGLLSFFSARARRKSKNSFSVSALDSRVHKLSISEGLEEKNFDFSEFQVVEKGTEIWVGGEDGNDVEKGSASSEDVKEVVHNRAEKLFRLMELDSIANGIKDLESMLNKNLIITTEKDEKKELDASEETVTREFLQMLDAEDNEKQMKAGISAEKDGNQETKALLPDLGHGLGPVIQTKDGGFMASMNPFNDEITRKETPKLALQISKPFILRDPKLSSGLEVFQRLATVGLEELCSKLTLMAALDELQGKTAGQIAFEGISSAIISGRNKEGASSIAAKSIGAVKRMISAMNEDRKRSFNENWTIKEDPLLLEEIIAFSIQRIEEMALEALKVQADMAEEESAFEVSPLTGKNNPCQILDSAISLDVEEKTSEESKSLTLLAIIQLRDPIRQYEVVGAPVIALIQAIRANDDAEDDDETRYKVISIHVGVLKVRSGEKKNAWDGEKSKLTATQWLVANGMGKLGKKSRPIKSKLQRDFLWSLSSRIMEDMWLRPVRNPDVKIARV